MYFLHVYTVTTIIYPNIQKQVGADYIYEDLDLNTGDSPFETFEKYLDQDTGKKLCLEMIDILKSSVERRLEQCDKNNIVSIDDIFAKRKTFYVIVIVF